MGGNFGRAITAAATMGGSEVWRKAGDLVEGMTPQVQQSTDAEEELRKEKKKLGAQTATAGGLLGTEYMGPQGSNTTFGN